MSMQASVSGDHRCLEDGLLSCSKTLTVKLQRGVPLQEHRRGSHALPGLAACSAVNILGMH